MTWRSLSLFTSWARPGGTNRAATTKSARDERMGKTSVYAFRTGFAGSGPDYTKSRPAGKGQPEGEGDSEGRGSFPGGGDEPAQPVLILDAGPGLDAAGDIDRIGPRHAHRLDDVLRVKPAGEN